MSTEPAHLIAIAVPADADNLEPWDDMGTGDWTRFFDGFKFSDQVRIVGMQCDDGAVARLVQVDPGPASLTQADARRLAETLLAAAAMAEDYDTRDNQQST